MTVFPLLFRFVACTAPVGEDRVEIEVFAASSLTEAFRSLEAAFERRHPEADVRLTLAGSQVLRLQIEQGAPADVFASADQRHVQSLVDQGRLGEVMAFAGNRLALVVPAHNPAGLRKLADLPRARRIVVGHGQVPIGAYTRTLLDRADAELGGGFGAAVRRRIVSEEPNVRLVRAKVELGEADAAIVYETDVRPPLRTIPLPETWNVPVRYPIGVVADAPNLALARAFVALVRSTEGRTHLANHGFVPVLE